MIYVMMRVMGQVNFATTLPAHAVAILRDRARHDGLPLNAWLARAIYDKATRDSVNDPRDDFGTSEPRQFIEDAETERAKTFSPDAGRATA